MTAAATQIVQKLWNYCNILRDDGLSYGDYVEQLTFLLFLKMADERTRPPFDQKAIKSSFPSVLDTLVHLLSAEWIWLQRWKGSSPTGWPEMQSMTSFELLRRRWSEIEAEQKAYIESRTEADLSAPVAYRSLKGDPFTNPLGDLAQHVVNHATYHRGQVTTMLRQLGYAPQPTDFVQFLRE